MSSCFQPGILAPLPAAARYLTLSLRAGADPRAALKRLSALVDGVGTVVGFGAQLLDELGVAVEGLSPFPEMTVVGSGLPVPATPAALWLWLRGTDRGALLHRSRALEAALEEAFTVEQVVDAFVHDSGRDLTGYEDGTENPVEQAAVDAAIVAAGAAAPAGSSFVAVQQWLHDFSAFESKSPEEQDHAIGRERCSNEEIEDAPLSAHVKRTAQEDFQPEAFVVRRSMPWLEGARAGLMFVAFGASLYAFEAQLRRMCGADDGIVDALFSFTQPITGAYFWCPPMAAGAVDFGALKL